MRWGLSLLIFGSFMPSFSSSLRDRFSRLSTPTLHLEFVRNLENSSSRSLASTRNVTAASGLVWENNRFWVVSDNEFSIFSFSKTQDRLQEQLILEKPPGMGPGEIKKYKPDFESLVSLSAELWPPHGALLAWPSASKERRVNAVLLELNTNGDISRIQKMNISSLAKAMSTHTKELNLEGLVVESRQTYFFQRGNGREGRNGLFSISTDAFLQSLKGRSWPKEVSYVEIDLGSSKGSPVTFSDAVFTSYGVFVLGTVENSSSTIDDGPFQATQLFLLKNQKVQKLGVFDQVVKLEGLAISEESDHLTLYLVDDADSEEPSRLFRSRISKSSLQ